MTAQSDRSTAALPFGALPVRRAPGAGSPAPARETEDPGGLRSVVDAESLRASRPGAGPSSRRWTVPSVRYGERGVTSPVS